MTWWASAILAFVLCAHTLLLVTLYGAWSIANKNNQLLMKIIMDMAKGVDANFELAESQIKTIGDFLVQAFDLTAAPINPNVPVSVKPKGEFIN